MNNYKRLKIELEPYIKESIEVENIPLCNNCLYEIEDGCYVCLTCKINLCPNHAFNHINTNNSDHKLVYLSINKA